MNLVIQQPNLNINKGSFKYCYIFDYSKGHIYVFDIPKNIVNNFQLEDYIEDNYDFKLSQIEYMTTFEIQEIQQLENKSCFKKPNSFKNENN